MGLDLYIEARIREKASGRVISAGSEEEYEEDGDKGFFEICWWCGWLFKDIRAGLVEICSRYAGTRCTDLDFVIPVPQPALRELYAFIVKRACIADEDGFEVSASSAAWEEHCAYERMNLDNAGKLHRLLYVLDSIENTNSVHMDYTVGEKYIPIEDDLKQFARNPQAYAWDFRIDNSY